MLCYLYGILRQRMYIPIHKHFVRIDVLATLEVVAAVALMLILLEG